MQIDSLSLSVFFLYLQELPETEEEVVAAVASTDESEPEVVGPNVASGSSPTAHDDGMYDMWTFSPLELARRVRIMLRRDFKNEYIVSRRFER